MSHKVLVVEDNMIAQRIASFIIKSCGDEPTVVSKGIDAIRLAKTNRYDLIILDIALPDMDGFTIKETLEGTGVNTPMVGLTAYSDIHEDQVFIKPLTRKLYKNMLCNKT